MRIFIDEGIIFLLVVNMTVTCIVGIHISNIETEVTKTTKEVRDAVTEATDGINSIVGDIEKLKKKLGM